VIETSIDVIETSIHAVDLASVLAASAVDASAQVEQRAKRHGGEDRERGPDGRIYLVRERSTAG